MNTLKEEHEQLRKLVYSGASQKKLALSDAVLDRISYELSVIEKQGFAEYFILFSRIAQICNELKLIRSYGRGNAAHSIVNYCLDISKINPLDEDLIFERFIIPHQVQLPDIDIDIPRGYQQIVIDKLNDEFPEYNTYFIAVPPKSDSDYKKIVHGNNSYEIHGSGVIITSEKLINSTFECNHQWFYLSLDPSSDILYDNKIDILELEYLNKFQLIVDEIGDEFHPYKLPLDDKNTFDFFVSGDLENIFQFNFRSLKKVLSQFQPNSISELSIINSMFRPGLVHYVETVVRNKFYPEEMFCPGDGRVSEILSETYGVLIYQESFLHLSKIIAGMAYSEAELWRRKLLRDKDGQEFVAFSNVFADGCREHSTLRESEIASLIDLISEMLRLAYHKSHSLCYTIIAYWGAFYKTHFRTQFDKAFSKEGQFQKFELY